MRYEAPGVCRLDACSMPLLSVPPCLHRAPVPAPCPRHPPFQGMLLTRSVLVATPARALLSPSQHQATPPPTRPTSPSPPPCCPPLPSCAAVQPCNSAPRSQPPPLPPALAQLPPQVYVARRPSLPFSARRTSALTHTTKGRAATVRFTAVYCQRWRQYGPRHGGLCWRRRAGRAGRRWRRT